ncbi:S-adenosyl-L-methionine-dependent methyltransferase [Aaosphaeria arxii CBS 175.79]|uniref:S-adenosyl-L-methionine-dependent methyltransferase n=1 Tax=Aaosphaeria arxii CBS 175.79 TaxID=1450172 RepID=A0A6A5XME1_9PLEO|nr:S-adenosyl-L-methionine-dependent methyltransferase [Aaosphaeria arxii CBS 175.79]KAF2014408.1 S-adenosyl-L-methionine-dependent methyltransferase [Aaosphaeria arxii CBS 175.79]
MSAPFAPKQALKFDPRYLLKLSAGLTRSVADQIVSNHIPPLSKTSRIHDNGCGAGEVAKALVEHNAVPAGATIAATDINTTFLDELNKALEENKSWPIESQVMDATALTYPDSIFALSVTNMVFANVKDDVATAKHIYRTLAPGGTGIVSVWKDSPWINITIDAHYRTRGSDAPLPPPLAASLYSVDHLSKALKSAEIENVQYEDIVVYGNMTDVKEWATIAWSFLARPPDGWTQADEDNWDKAIGIIVNDLINGDFTHEENGVYKVKMIATAAIFKK